MEIYNTLKGFRHYKCRFTDNDINISDSQKIDICILFEDEDISVAHEKTFRKNLRYSKRSSKKTLFNASSKIAFSLGAGSNSSTTMMQGNSLGPNSENIVFFPKNDQPVCQDITAGKNSEFSIIFIVLLMILLITFIL